MQKIPQATVGHDHWFARVQQRGYGQRDGAGSLQDEHDGTDSG
ncbi:hypothetical protein [Nocardia yamanashiensis]|nr:hypothetical protein [Nocardia yamanashiensis]